MNGIKLERAGKVFEAIVYYRDWMLREPRNIEPVDRLLMLYRQNCMFDEIDALEPIWIEMLKDARHGFNPFNLLCSDNLSLDAQHLAIMKYSDWLFEEGEEYAVYCKQEQIRVKAPGEKLRIGYLCGDFQLDHPTVQLGAGVLSKHDRSQFDIRYYSWGQPLFELPFCVSPDKWTNLYSYGSNAAAAAIFHDGIDILVDLNGYAKGRNLKARPEILVHKPAPLVVNWLGYPGSLGNDDLADYIIGDPRTTPMNDWRYIDEKVAYMPLCYQPNDDSLYMPKPAMRKKDGKVIYCSLNSLYKITRKRFALWCSILGDVPGSVLWLLRISGPAEAMLRIEAEKHGIAGSRIVFQPWIANWKDHITRLMEADIMLDTSAYGSHTTASDAVRAGLPIVTVEGESFSSRACASITGASGAVGGICETDADYHRVAVKLGLDVEARTILRACIFGFRERKGRLFDTEHFTQKLEALYLEMWRLYTEGKRENIYMHLGD